MHVLSHVQLRLPSTHLSFFAKKKLVNKYQQQSKAIYQSTWPSLSLSSNNAQLVIKLRITPTSVASIR